MRQHPMTVLYLSVHADLGGAERTVLNLLRYHDRTKVRPLLCTLRDGHLAREAARLGVPAWVVPATRFRHPINLWRTTSAIRKIIRQEGVGLVHSVMGLSHLYAWLGARGTGARVLWFQQGNVGRPTLVDRVASLAPSAAIFANSHHTAEIQRRVWSWTGEIAVVHLGVDLREFSLDRTPDGKPWRQAWGIPEHHAVVGMAGRLQPWKGQHVFLEAVEIVARRFRNATFLLVGDALFGLDAGYKHRLQETTRRQGLDRVVRFVGFQEDMAPVYAAMDVVVHASVAPEPFGLVVAEAMAMARPVIASDGGGPREIVEDGVTGWLTPMGDPTPLADRIGHLLEDADLRARMGGEARRRVEEHFSVERMTLRIEEVYDRILGRGIHS